MSNFVFQYMKICFGNTYKHQNNWFFWNFLFGNSWWQHFSKSGQSKKGVKKNKNKTRKCQNQRALQRLIFYVFFRKFCTCYQHKRSITWNFLHLDAYTFRFAAHCTCLTFFKNLFQASDSSSPPDVWGLLKEEMNTDIPPTIKKMFLALYQDFFWRGGAKEMFS